MMIFVSIAVAAFILVCGSFMFGGDHDVDHDAGDVSHDIDAGDNEPAISIFSTKVIGTLLMGFGAAGAIAMYYGANHLIASLIGLGCGILLGGFTYLILELLYKQQASSLIATNSAVGCTGRVTVSIPESGQGEVSLQVDGLYCTYSASSTGGAIPKGELVRVIQTLGSQLVVEKE